MSYKNEGATIRQRRSRGLLPIVCAAFLGLTAAPHDAGAAGNPTVRVDQGTLTGLEAAGVQEFLGVRYAMPPVGDLRWQPPVPLPPGRAKIDATQFGNNCPQNSSPWGTPSTSEDCLVLNI